MAELDSRQLAALVVTAEMLAKALAAAEQKNDCIDSSQMVLVDSDDDDKRRLNLIWPDVVPQLFGNNCWLMRDMRTAGDFLDRFTAHAELATMLKIIRNAVTNLPEFGSVTVDDVPAGGG